jgi:RNA polymerase sigma-70 factor (ECF subfamily)
MRAAVTESIIGPIGEFEGLFREHYQLVYRTAYGITGRAEDAEDVLQTVFLRLLRRGSPPEFQRNAKGYLYRAAVNRSLDVLQARQRQVPTDHVFPVQETSAPIDAEPFGVTHRQLSRALSQLQPRAVEILLLRYTHDYSDAEIGKMLGTSRGVIAVTLFRARRRLKKLLTATPNDREKS